MGVGINIILQVGDNMSLISKLEFNRLYMLNAISCCVLKNSIIMNLTSKPKSTQI